MDRVPTAVPNPTEIRDLRTTANARRHEMTDLARRAAIETTTTPYAVEISPLLLPLPRGSAAKTVYVKTFQTSTGKVAGFALQETSPAWLFGGMTWAYDPSDLQYGLFITFVLGDGIEELQCKELPLFWFSDPSSSDDSIQRTQASCAPVAAVAGMEYHFTVTFTDQTKFDPKIVITVIS
jgi:hypothetical protein